jgi:tRNA (guanine-N7-)-methyltransferase
MSTDNPVDEASSDEPQVNHSPGKLTSSSLSSPEQSSPEQSSPKQPSPRQRGIKSFVLRQGRLTQGQSAALESSWPKLGRAIADGAINWAREFGNASPVVIEIGFGMGDSLAEQARLNPEYNYLGIEVHRPGVGHLLIQAEKYELENVRVYAEDSIDVLNSVVPDKSVSVFQIFFPDPWHKKKHHKRRLIDDRFIALLRQKLKTGGLVHIATDWAHYSEEIIETFVLHTAFEPMSPPARPETKFERRGQKLGHKISDLAYRLVDE